VSESVEQPVEQPWYEDVVIPALLRAARNTYAHSIRDALDLAGFTDIPRNGAFVLGGLRNSGQLGDLSDMLKVSKQAVSQLLDTLVLRGYLDRSPDSDDRRRMNVVLTERGEAAAVAIADGVAEIDAALAARVPAADVSAMRATLGALALIGVEHSHDEE
jgi:DNA-binding MarR family transcriptional regulator